MANGVDLATCGVVLVSGNLTLPIDGLIV
jgi:hypothetical protein